MAWQKRRKGKQSTGRTTPLVPPKDTSNVPEESKDLKDEESLNDKQARPKKAKESEDSNDMDTEATPPSSPIRVSPGSSGDHDLVLTSEKRRGVYECDYCHSDISQLPRIRCAVCHDFDLCLDCFATTDHSAAIARLKAADTAHAELKADGIASTHVSGISAGAANHDGTHGYRVCDSTRYPILATTRLVQKSNSNSTANSSATSTVADAASVTSGEKVEDNLGVTSSDEAKSSDTESNRLEGESSANSAKNAEYMVTNEDPKSIWTAEEDLRLLDAIKTHGLGNWTDIADAIGGNGSVGKTPKRCMERYFDDFLGRYGHIVPQYTVVQGSDDDDTADIPTETDIEDETVRASKRRQSQLSRQSSGISSSSVGGGRARKRYKVVPTETLPGYDQIWPCQFVPSIPGVQIGQEVARDLSTKNEQAFVKACAMATTKEQADLIRKEWMETRLNQIGAPTVLPPRPEDNDTLPGADLIGFMPRRGEFDIEYENDAEAAVADMEFTTADSEADKQLKLQVLQIYYQKQLERGKRKKFILSRELYQYKKYIKDEQELPQDERDLVHRMRLFERFHTPEEHKQFIHDILKAKRLRKEIAKLQMYRRIGIRSLAEAEQYELDKIRRQFHSAAQMQKTVEDKQAASPSRTASSSQAASQGIKAAVSSSAVASASSMGAETEGSDSLWKQYRTSDRKVRRSLNRTSSGTPEKVDNSKLAALSDKPSDEGDTAKPNNDKVQQEEQPEKAEEKQELESNNVTSGVSDMDIDTPKDSGAPLEDTTNSLKQTTDSAQGGSAEESMDVDEISQAKGYGLLNGQERELCVRLKIHPRQYLEIKKVLIHESLTKGLLEKEGPGSGRRTVVKMDVERRGNVVDFMLRAGWISNHLAKVARTVTPPPETEE